MNGIRKVTGIGESILDILFHGNQPQRAVPGGSTFNCMISLARCGVPALFISELGNDPVGKLIRSFMEENRLSTAYLDCFEEGQTPVALAFQDENGQTSYSFYKDFPEKRLNVSFPEINENDLLVFGSYFAVNPALRKKVLELLEIARKQKAFIYYDMNFRKAHAGERQALMPGFIENFRFASLVRCSDEDLETLFPGQTPDEIYTCYFLPENKNLIITQGANDVLLKTPLFEKSYPVEAIIPLSSIGAGDNFNAGFLYGIIRYELSAGDFRDLPENQWDKLMAWGQRFAGEVCRSMDNYVSPAFVKTHLQ